MVIAFLHGKSFKECNEALSLCGYPMSSLPAGGRSSRLNVAMTLHWPLRSPSFSGQVSLSNFDSPILPSKGSGTLYLCVELVGVSVITDGVWKVRRQL